MLDQFYTSNYCPDVSSITTEGEIAVHTNANDLTYDVERGMSQRQKNLIVTFVRRNQKQLLENIEDYKWESLIRRLNTGPGPNRTLDAWKQAVVDCASIAVAKRNRMQESSDEAFVQSLTPFDVKLLVNLGHLRPVAAPASPVLKGKQKEENIAEQDKISSATHEIIDRLLDSHVKDNQDTVQLLDNLTYVLADLDNLLTRITPDKSRDQF